MRHIEPACRYDAAPVTREPGRFLRSAAGGLRSGLRIARPLFLANMRARHRRALLGYMWLILPGLVSAFALTMLRKSALFTIGAIELPYPLFVLSGVFLWQSFVEALTMPMQHMLRQRYFLSIVPAPHDGVLLAALAEVLVNLLIRILILEAVMLLFGLHPAVQWLLVPLAGLAMVTIGYAVGLVITPIGLLYDDVVSMAGLLATFGLFLAPVLYPIPPGSVLASNPLVPVMTAARDWMSGRAAEQSFLPGLALALLFLVIGWLLIALSRPHLSARAH